MYSRLVIDGNAVYEIDEECVQKKKNRGSAEHLFSFAFPVNTQGIVIRNHG